MEIANVNDNGKVEEECNKIISTKLEQWKEHLQTDYESKINEIKEQKCALTAIFDL